MGCFRLSSRKLIAVLIILLLFQSAQVMAATSRIDNEEWNEYDAKGKAGAANDPKTQLTQDQIRQVPAKDLTPEAAHRYAKDLSPKQKKELNSDQLANKDGNGQALLDKMPANEFDEDARNEALKKLGRTEKEVETNTDENPSKVKSHDDGFEIDQIQRIKVGDVDAIGVTDYSYRGGIIKIGSANTIQISDGILSDVTNFQGDAISFSVDESTTVINKCVTITGVEDSDFQIYSNAIKVNTSENTEFDITDCADNEVNFDSMSNESEIIISKDTPPKYMFQKGILKVNNSDYEEAIIGNNTVIAEMGLQGISPTSVRA